MKHFLALPFLATTLLAAHPGETIYQTLCAACHGPDGKGVGEGANKFPPLYESDWVKGNPRRMIQVVLGGLQGPVTVNDKDYNLLMPPHGGSMTDQQIADVVSYVRTHLGNKGKEVTLALVKEERAKADNPVMPNMWTADKLLKKYPLGGVKKPPINDLLSYIHHGPFRSLADLRASEATNVEEEKGGLISLTQADKKDAFGLVWEGWLEVPKDGTYEFAYDTDDGGAITINGKEVITRDRTGPFGKPSIKKVPLKKGRAEIKVEYFEFAGKQAISLMWNGPGVKDVALSVGAKKQKAPAPEILLTPPAGEALIYRNFISGTDPRAIGVGYAEGVNLAFSADSMSVDMIWTGKFIDAGRHWTARGQGSQPPAGNNVVTLSRGPAFALLESQTEPWPSADKNSLKRKFQGYHLNKAQQPTFNYRMGEVAISDQPLPGETAAQLTRTLTLEVPASAAGSDALYFRALSGGAITASSEREFTFGKIKVAVPESNHPPFIRANELLIPVPLTEGTHTIQLTYTWN